MRLMEEEDVPHKVRWVNDPVVRATLNFDYPISDVGTRQWLARVTADPSRRDFTVCLRDGSRPIGYAGLIGIDWRHSKAELYMGIGETDHWGQGLGTEIRRLQLDYGFGELGLSRLFVFNLARNEAAIAVNTKLGMTIEGRLRKDIFSHGQHEDRLLLAILRDDYLARAETDV